MYKAVVEVRDKGKIFYEDCFIQEVSETGALVLTSSDGNTVGVYAPGYWLYAEHSEKSEDEV